MFFIEKSKHSVSFQWRSFLRGKRTAGTRHRTRRTNTWNNKNNRGKHHVYEISQQDRNRIPLTTTNHTLSLHLWLLYRRCYVCLLLPLVACLRDRFALGGSRYSCRAPTLLLDAHMSSYIKEHIVALTNHAIRLLGQADLLRTDLV